MAENTQVKNPETITNDDYVIEMLNITKEFPGIIANDDITLQLRRGEIHALLGENGAGKSTLMSVLFGLYIPEKGTIKKNGQVVNIKGPNDANDLGIEILGFSGKKNQIDFLTKVLADNPLCQGNQCTPMGIIRKAR